MYGDDRDTIYKTNYRDSEGTEKLTNYLQHDGQAVRDRTGRPMSDKEIEQFNDTAAGRRNRHIIVSPCDHEELSDRELDRATREYMSEMIEDRPTADYVYSVHDDKEDGKDVHIAMTATDEQDLEMYPDDIRRERKQAHESYLEHGRDRAQEQEQEQQQEHGNDRDSGRAR